MTSKQPSVLLLTRESFPSKRAVINKLWCKVIPDNSVNLIWVSESNIKSSKFAKVTENLNILNYTTSQSNNVLIRNFKSIITKFRISNFLVKNKLVNQCQARNGVTDGLICIILKIVYGLPFSFHLSSLHGFEDHQLIEGWTGLQKTKIKFVTLFDPFLYRLIFYFSSLIQPISISMGDYLHSNLNIKNSKIFPLPISALKNEISLEDKRTLSNNPTLVYTGTLTKQRDISFIFKVASNVMNEFPNVRLRIIGNIEKNTDLNSFDEELNYLKIKNRTDFFFDVPVNKVFALINECDIGISSINPLQKFLYSTPTKTIEYMSCGLSFVCNSEIYDHEMIVNESDAGFSVPYKIDSFSDAIIKILEDKKRYSQMSLNGRQWLYNNRTYDDIGPKLAAEYMKLIKK